MKDSLIMLVIFTIWVMLFGVIMNDVFFKHRSKICEEVCLPNPFEWNKFLGCTCKSWRD